MTKTKIKNRKPEGRDAYVMIRKDGRVHTNRHGLVVFARAHDGMDTMELDTLFHRFHIPGREDEDNSRTLRN